jgi:hypothetical protein
MKRQKVKRVVLRYEPRKPSGLQTIELGNEMAHYLKGMGLPYKGGFTRVKI